MFAFSFQGEIPKKSNSGSDASFTLTQASPLTWAAPHWHTDTFCWELVICTSWQSFELLLLEVLWMLCLCQIWEIKTGAGVCARVRLHIWARCVIYRTLRRLTLAVFMSYCFTGCCAKRDRRWHASGEEKDTSDHILYPHTHTHLDIILTLFPKSATHTHTHTCIHPTQHLTIKLPPWHQSRIDNVDIHSTHTHTHVTCNSI